MPAIIQDRNTHSSNPQGTLLLIDRRIDGCRRPVGITISKWINLTKAFFFLGGIHGESAA